MFLHHSFDMVKNVISLYGIYYHMVQKGCKYDFTFNGKFLHADTRQAERFCQNFFSSTSIIPGLHFLYNFTFHCFQVIDALLPAAQNPRLLKKKSNFKVSAKIKIKC